LAALIWIAQIETLSNMSGSDATGNGLAQGFAMLEIILLWLLLAVMLFMASVLASMPIPVVVPGLVLIPASGLSALSALDFHSRGSTGPYLWPIVISAAVPPLISLLCLWSIISPVRTSILDWCAAGVVWVTTLMLSASIFPLRHLRHMVEIQRGAERDMWAANFAKPAEDAPLLDRIRFLETPDATRVDQVIAGITRLDRGHRSGSQRGRRAGGFVSGRIRTGRDAGDIEQAASATPVSPVAAPSRRSRTVLLLPPV
jgi:hypothetical protein